MSEPRQINRWRDAAGKTIKKVIEYACGAPDVGAVIVFECGSFAALMRSEEFDPDLVGRTMALDEALSPEELVAEGICTEEQAADLHRQREEKKRQEDLAELKTLTHRLDALKQKLGPIETPSATPVENASGAAHMTDHTQE